MTRSPNTNTNGKSFDLDTVNMVWQKAKRIANSKTDSFREDICGSIIAKSAYGKTAHEYGWEIDHIKPVSKGGTDQIDNLQPLHWETNRAKSDTYPWTCGTP